MYVLFIVKNITHIFCCQTWHLCGHPEEVPVPSTCSIRTQGHDSSPTSNTRDNSSPNQRDNSSSSSNKRWDNSSSNTRGDNFSVNSNKRDNSSTSSSWNKRDNSSSNTNKRDNSSSSSSSSVQNTQTRWGEAGAGAGPQQGGPHRPHRPAPDVRVAEGEGGPHGLPQVLHQVLKDAIKWRLKN